MIELLTGVLVMLLIVGIGHFFDQLFALFLSVGMILSFLVVTYIVGGLVLQAIGVR